MSDQTVSISFFRFKGLGKRWALQQLWTSRYAMRKQPGIGFFKLLGTGGGLGYDIWPDFSTYAILAVWDNRKYADEFLNLSRVSARFNKNSEECYTILLKPISSRGTWSGVAPFNIKDKIEYDGPVAVLTRATLKLRYMRGFWSKVAGVSRSHEGSSGLIFTKGVGEIPLMEQATFSIWESMEDMVNFAYKAKYHAEAIAATRAADGFREEMFSRFRPIATFGTYRDKDPVGQYLTL